VEKNQLIDVPKLLVFVGFIDIYKWLMSNKERRRYKAYLEQQAAFPAG